jgi:hypothetical protein
MYELPNKMENNWARMRHLLLLSIGSTVPLEFSEGNECKNPHDHLFDLFTMVYDIENELGR